MRSRFEKLLSYAALLAVLAAAPTAMAATITGWTFETSIPLTAGPHAAEVGTGSATGSHTGAATYSSPAGNGSLHSFSSNTWTTVGDYYQFTTSSVGQSNIGIAWEETRSGTGPSAFEVQYTTDGSTYTAIPAGLIPAYTVQAVTWNTTTVDGTGNSNFIRDLSTITALNNNATIGFRLVSTAAAATAGTNRVDNFKILSDVPEPCTAILIGMVGFAFVACSRRSIC